MDCLGEKSQGPAFPFFVLRQPWEPRRASVRGANTPARPPTARLVEAPKGRPRLSTWEKRGKQGPQNYFYIITQLDWDFHNFSFLKTTKTNKKQINKTRLHRKNLVFNTHNVSIDQIERIGRVCNLINKQIPAFDELI